jgi:hypothetical protein
MEPLMTDEESTADEDNWLKLLNTPVSAIPCFQQAWAKIIGQDTSTWPDKLKCNYCGHDVPVITEGEHKGRRAEHTIRLVEEETCQGSLHELWELA